MRQKLLLLLLGVLSTLPALSKELPRLFKYTYEGNTITYSVIDEDAKTCSVTSENSTATSENGISGALVLPANPKDGDIEFTLTHIAYSAFSGCIDLKSVVIPNSVTSIGSRAFYGCSGLLKVEIPNSVTAIGEYAFCRCSNLQAAIIPNQG